MSDPLAGILFEQGTPPAKQVLPADPLAGMDIAPSPYDPLAALDTVGKSMDERVRLAVQSASGIQVPFAQRHPIANALLAEPVNDAANALVAAFMPQQQLDVLAQDDPEGTIRFVQSGQRGLALIASMVPGTVLPKGLLFATSVRGGVAVSGALPGVATLPRLAAGKLITKTGAFLASEFLGGAAYGAIEPLREDESRVGAVVKEGALFAGISGIFAGGITAIALGARGLARRIGALAQAEQKKVIAQARSDIQQLHNQMIADGAVDGLNGLPPETRAQVVTEAYSEAAARLDPSVRDLDAIAREEAERARAAADVATEPHPRFGEPPRATIGTGPGLHIVELEDPVGQLELLRPFEAPPRVEPIAAPIGLLRPTDEVIAARNVIRATPGATAASRTTGQPLETVTLSKPLAEHTDVELRRVEARIAENMARYSRARTAGEETIGNMDAAVYDFQVAAAERAFRVKQLAQIEPQAVTLPTSPPEGFEPTIVGEIAEGAHGGVVQLALGNEAADTAVRRLDPVELMAPQIQSVRSEIENALNDPGITRLVRNKRLRDAIDKAIGADVTASTEGVLLALTEPTPAKMLTKSQRAASEALDRSLAREATGLIEVHPGELVRASYAYAADAPLATPAVDALSVMGRFADNQLEVLTDRLRKSAVGEAGFITPRALALILGSGAEVVSFNENLDKPAQNVWRAVGGLVLAAALYPRFKDLGRQYAKKLLLHVNPATLMSAAEKAPFASLVETRTWARELGYTQEQLLRKVFPDEGQWRAAVVAIEESDFAQGVFPAEYFTLSPQQQQAVSSLNLFNKALGQLLQTEGVLRAYRRNYISHRLPAETFAKWRTHGYSTLPTAGGFTKQRIFSFRELEQWAQANGLQGPITDIGALQGKHIEEAYRAMGNVRLVRTLENQGLIQKLPKMTAQIPQGWRQLDIRGYGDRIAPDAVASALRNMSTPGSSHSELLNAADTIKSWWMRSIMYWFWEHGINALRASVLSSVNPTLYKQSFEAVRRMDPGLLEAAKYGLNLRHRTDYAALAKSVGKAIAAVKSVPGLAQIVELGGKGMEINERVLWHNIVPTMQYAVYTKEMQRWTARTGGKFLPGTTQYTEAARKAASVANTALGRLPTDLANPRLMQWLRLLMFSPQWTISRAAITAHAAGELSEVMAGRLNPLQGTYLPMKIRQVIYTAAVTWGLSKMLSGEEPEFNPNTRKLYARTGLRNAQGREIGLDVLGFWQDDLKLFNAPFDFVASRLNPVLRVVGETVNGRDYMGRDMRGIDKFENIIRSLGVPTETAELAARGIQSAVPGGAPPMSGGEVLQRVSGALATFNVATLPRPMDAAIGKMAERLLRRQGVPVNSDNVWELSRLIRSNILNGTAPVNNSVVLYLAFRRQSHMRSSPIFGPAEHLWQEGRRVLAEF